MENINRLSLKKEIEKEAIIIEETVLSNSEIKNVEASSEMDKSLYQEIEEYNKKKLFNEQLSEELVPNFSECTNENSVILLSEEDKEALRLGRELMKNKKKETLYEVNTELHKHLNYKKKKSHKNNKTT